jgi:hypothetical protein
VPNSNSNSTSSTPLSSPSLSTETPDPVICTEPMEVLHLPIQSEGRKQCLVCRMEREKANDKSKIYVYGKYYCKACDEAFCLNTSRNCFTKYHQENAVALGLAKSGRKGRRI